MKKANGVLAEALRNEINRRDLAIKEAAQLIHRSERIVYMVLRGEKVSARTLTQIEIAFPQAFAE